MEAQAIVNEPKQTTEEQSKRYQQVQERLEQSKKLREEQLQQKKEAQQVDKAEDEDYQQIDAKFNKDFDNLELLLTQWEEKVKGKPKKEIEDHFKEIFAQYQELRDYVNNYTFAIPQSFFGLYNQKLNQFQDNFNTQKELALPKKKFSFASKKQNVKKQEKKVEEVKKEEEIKFDEAVHLSIKDLQNQKIEAKLEDYQGKENVILENLTDCEITIPFVVKCIYLKNIQKCKLYLAAVSGATFINNCCDTEVYLASHQIRIHNSKNTKFYLVARSNPIIEDCSELGFGDLTLTEWGDKFAAYRQEAELDKKNLFEEVHDFKWLKQDHSPNWYTIEQQKQ